MDWRKLLMGKALLFLVILRKEHAEASSDNASYIFDDTTLEKIGFCHNCRRYKCYYIALRGKLGDQSVRIFYKIWQKPAMKCIVEHRPQYVFCQGI